MDASETLPSGPDGFIYVVSNADPWGRGRETGLLLRVRPSNSIDEET